MKPVLPLSDLKIRNLRPKEKTYKAFDGGGLYLEVLPSGTKSWRLKHKAGNQDKRESFGKWPEVSLKRARELAAGFKAKLGDAPQSPAISPQALFELWQDKFLGQYTGKEIKIKKRFIYHYILPKISHIGLNELTPAQLLESVFKPIEEASHFETAHRVKGLLSQVLTFGVSSGYLAHNVARDLDGALAPKPKAIHRPSFVDKEKVGRLVLATRTYSGSPAVTYALRILPYVFVRPGELRHAEWGEISLGEKVWRLPPEKMKMRRPHIVPLSCQVAQMLSELRRHTGQHKLVFPGSRVITRPISDAAINAALRYLGYERGEICGHGFRSMASTLLNEMGYNTDWIERQLAHVEGNSVRAAYNYAQYLPERQKMMQDWADFLDSLADKACLPR
ncbi:MAG: tyrosine-type recombinase/integrase [Deltaproteobacteria bacterium]|jgi:integrase|nr:tyrosine-type recombinase/integrase [Deltaproteobacteria bacterium]